MTEAQVREQQRKELKKAYRDVFSGDKGKMVLADLAAFCGQDRSSVCEQSPDPYQTMFAEGKRRVYLRINTLRSKDE